MKPVSCNCDPLTEPEHIYLSFFNRKKYPPFSLDRPLYDQSKFSGRFLHFIDVVDPFTLFVSHKKLEDALLLIQQFKDRTLSPNFSNENIWKAKKIIDSMIHPQTIRMSAFIPASIPLAFGVTMTKPTLFNVLFWQWMNQTYNSCVNYANRNASNKQSVGQLALAYTTSVTVACGVALGLGKLLNNSQLLRPSLRSIVKIAVPYTAVALASVSNVVLTRFNEMVDGVNVFDQDKRDLGASPSAGKIVISQVAASRAFLPAPILILPPLIMKGLLMIKGIRINPRIHFPLELGVIAAALWVALPASIGLFPQECKIDVNKLEKKFQNLKHKDGSSVSHVICNKGL